MAFKDAFKKKGGDKGFPPSGDKGFPEDEKGMPPAKGKGGFKAAAKNAKKKKGGKC